MKLPINVLGILLSGMLVLATGAVRAQILAVCPANFAAYGQTSTPLACTCTAEAAKSGPVWGSDVYTSDSSICRAALHAGIIGARGGRVMVMPEAGRGGYAGIARNGVVSNKYGAYRSSFGFVGAPPRSTAATAPPAAPDAAPACPGNFVAFAETGSPVTCACTAEATAQGQVWGLDIYTSDSSICRAALHTGIIGPRGGEVTVIPETGLGAYAGAARNGVTSRIYGPYRNSFRFEGVAVSPQALVPSCPANFIPFAGAADPLVCVCPAEATAQGTVWGADVYTTDSSVCRAALHAGIIDAKGGEVTVIPDAGLNAYAGVARNGVMSRNYGAYQTSFRFAGAPATAAAQAPSAPSAPAAPAATVTMISPSAPAALTALTAPPASGLAEVRVALVIGNSSYTAVPALPNPSRDGEAVASALRAVGFKTVIVANDVTRSQFTDVLREFAQVAEKADWAIVYYAGHGIEMGGTNYLIPVDARLATDRDVQFEAVPLDQALAATEGAKKLRLVVLDACRNNPFAQQMRRTGSTRSVSRGLRAVEPAAGTLVVYAAKDGEVALDGDGQNSPFAAAFVQNLMKPGIEVNKMFRLVRDDVMDATRNRQEPFTYGALPGRVDFFFQPQQATRQ